LTPAQSRYTADEIEMMSLALALKQYEALAIHRRITVVTDNVHLLHFQKWHSINNRQRRLVVYLMQFQLVLKYVKGVHNITADTLSRMYQDLPEGERVKCIPEPSQDDFIVSVSDRREQSNSHSNQPNSPDVMPLVVSPLQDDNAVKLMDSAGGMLSDTALVASGETSTEIEVDESKSILLPNLTAQDYEADEEFGHMFRYLKFGQLSGENEIDRLTLLLCDQYVLENDAMFRLSNPQKRKKQRVRPLVPRLCVPRRFRHELLKYQHEILGHFGVNRSFLTLSNRYYWKQLFNDIREFCHTCDVCLRSKRDYTHKTAPLNPLQVPPRPFYAWQTDHKTLTRKTKNGNTALLVFIDAFSNWPIIRAVPDCSAETTARVFVEAVISNFGIPQVVMSDRGSAYTATFFKETMRLLGITHRMSATQAPRSNGLAENLIGRISQMLKIYAKNDLEIETVLPVIEMSLRANAHTRLGISPFEIIHGFPMYTAAPAEISLSTPAVQHPSAYLRWLKGELQDIHETVRQRKEDVKLDDKKQYDKQNKVQEPSWTVGQKVLLCDKRIRPHSDKVVTHRPFNAGPFFIADIVQGQAGIGKAFRLIDVESGKSVNKLVSGDRLKAYMTDRTHFSSKLPRLMQDRSDADSDKADNSNQSQGAFGPTDKLIPSPQTETLPGLEPAKRIIRERMQKGKREFLVLFQDGSTYWCDEVTPLLLQKFRLMQARRRKRDRQRRK